VFFGVGAVGLSAALAACDPSVPSEAGPSPAPLPSTFPAPTAPIDLARVADIPVGGGVVFPHNRVVVTQPAAGHLVAFSAVCTHEGCKVSQVANGTIDCPCHGSRFSIVDGSVVRGPATSPLRARSITVDGGSVLLAP
jgi:Rieske Fe-S protein